MSPYKRRLVIEFLVIIGIFTLNIVSAEQTKYEDAWHGCSIQNSKTVQREWDSFLRRLTTDNMVAVMDEIWSKMAEVSPEGTQMLRTFYLGPLHLFPEERRKLEETLSNVDFLFQQGILVGLLDNPDALGEHLRHMQAKLKVKRKPDGVVSLPEAAWEQLSKLFENTIIETIRAASSGFSETDWRGCFRTLGMLVYEATPPREVYYATCDVDKSSGDPTKMIQGTIVFEQKVGELTSRIKIDLTGFNSDDDHALHGFHIHSVGDTGGLCANAGGHFNPQGNNHGAPTSDERHIGDLGNIQEDDNGEVHTIISDHQALLLGADGIFDKSVVIHARGDDLGLGDDSSSLKTGNAGGRVACCVIKFAPHLVNSAYNPAYRKSSN